VGKTLLKSDSDVVAARFSNSIISFGETAV